MTHLVSWLDTYLSTWTFAITPQLKVESRRLEAEKKNKSITE